jgi:hypothetical protein
MQNTEDIAENVKRCADSMDSIAWSATLAVVNLAMILVALSCLVIK